MTSFSAKINNDVGRLAEKNNEVIPIRLQGGKSRGDARTRALDNNYRTVQ
jgi:hypothetical protein